MISACVLPTPHLLSGWAPQQGSSASKEATSESLSSNSSSLCSALCCMPCARFPAFPSFMAQHKEGVSPSQPLRSFTAAAAKAGGNAKRVKLAKLGNIIKVAIRKGDVEKDGSLLGKGKQQRFWEAGIYRVLHQKCELCSTLG